MTVDLVACANPACALAQLLGPIISLFRIAPNPITILVEEVAHIVRGDPARATWHWRGQVSRRTAPEDTGKAINILAGAINSRLKDDAIRIILSVVLIVLVGGIWVQVLAGCYGVEQLLLL